MANFLFYFRGRLDFMRKTFFKFLSSVENEISAGVDVPYSRKTRSTVKALISFVESGVYTKSPVDQFIAKNFRCATTELAALWNCTVGNKPKTQNTFRGQISLLNNYILSIFSCSLEDFEKAFSSNDDDFCDRVVSIIYAFSFEDSIVSTAFSFLDSYVDVFRTDKVFSLEDCKAELGVLKTLNERNIKELLSSIDMEKLYYILSVCKQPLLKNESIAVANRKKSVKAAKLNDEKVNLCRHFEGVEPLPLKTQGFIPIEIERSPFEERNNSKDAYASPYTLDLNEDLSKLLSIAIANYEAYEVKCIDKGKPNKFVVSATSEDYKKARDFFKALTPDGFKAALLSMNPYCLVDVVKKKYMRKEKD